jgi:hypothetical protein
MEMSAEEMEKKKEMVLRECICSSCPTWVECGEKGGFCFPTIGKSSCIEEQRGCVCGGCPVYAELNLGNEYYCIKGSEKEQNMAQ